MVDQDKFKQLELSYEKERIKPDEDFTLVLRNASFGWEKNPGLFYARFDYEYVNKIKNISGGALKHFMEAVLTDLCRSHNNYTYVYLNEISVNYILNELEYYADNKEWRMPQGGD